MDVAAAFQKLGISLLLGLLVGIQRERVEAPMAGVRTFALITLFGTLAGLLAEAFGPWTVPAGLLAVAVTMAIGRMPPRSSPMGPGITTEVAILVMYGVGAYLVLGHAQVAVVLGAGTAVLLHAKPVMHGFVKRLGETDMRVMMQFVLIALVIFPVLPDRRYGPFDVFNPRDIWRMVVLVVAISLGAYVALKLYGARAGLLIAGLIGGLISSTATTASYARGASRSQKAGAAAALVVMLATSVVYVRVLVEVAVVGGRAFPALAPPIAIMLAAAAVVSAVEWWRAPELVVESEPHENPTQLRSALFFGALYALVLLAVATARHHLGDPGIYLAAGVSGLTDMDAITLGTSQLAASGSVTTAVAWRAIVVAVISNLVFKLGLVAALGGGSMARRVAPAFAIQVAVGAALLVGWAG